MSRTAALLDSRPITFKWTSSYLGYIEYEVFGDGPKYTLELRHHADDYERSIFNGSEEEWQRDVVALIDVLRRKHDVTTPMDPRVIEAFNAWRKSEHEKFLAEVRAKPEKYDLPENDPLRIPPPIVRGGHYAGDQGWVIDAEVSIEDASPSP